MIRPGSDWSGCWRRSLAAAVGLMALTTAFAAETRPQPVLLPMKELLKLLDAKQEWMLLPIDDYHALVAAAAAAGKQTKPNPPEGAWIESGRIDGVLADDRELRLEATLAVASVAPRPARCRLFAALPGRLGAIAIDGQPALYATGGDGLDVLTPGAGRHTVTVSWLVRFDEGDRQTRRAILPLPLAGGLDLRLRSLTPGAFSGEALAEDEGAKPAAAAGTDQRVWRLVRAVGANLPLAWHPGRLAAGDESVFGLRQSVQVAIQPGQCPFRWTARLEPRRGEMPAELRVTLPAGWTATTPGAGVVGIEGDAELRLRIDPQAREIACDGFMAPSAAVALHRVAGAAYQDGAVTVTADGPLDYVLPAGWRVQAAAETVGDRLNAILQSQVSRTFTVPSPDAGMAVAVSPKDAGVAVATSSCLMVGPTPQELRLDEIITVAGNGPLPFALPLQLPPGWRLTRFNANAPYVIAELSGGDEVKSLPPGSLLNLRLVGHAEANRDLVLELAMERDTTQAADPPPKEGAAAAPVQVGIATIASARRSAHRLVVTAAPSLDTRLQAGAGWRLNALPEPFSARQLPLVHTELLCTGEPTLIGVVASRKSAACEAEAVLYLLPNPGETWCRLDLRLRVNEGELEGLRLTAPFTKDAKLDDQLFALTVEGEAFVLKSNRPWRGEHLLRIEGPLAAAAAGILPKLALASLPAAGSTAPATDLPLRQILALQASAVADLSLKPESTCTPIDEDDLPAWSKAIPGEPVFAAYRCLLTGALGGYALVERPLAPVPTGFCDAVRARTQIGEGGATTLVRLRLATRGAQALPLGLPSGASLLEATVDGLVVAVRHEGQDLVLPLPGRTQVQLAVRYASPAPTADYRLALPRFGDLPVTLTDWTVAVEDLWRVRVVEAPDAMPVLPVSGEANAWRPWFGNWRSRMVDVDAEALPQPLVGQQNDSRALAATTTATPPTGEPTLTLVGHLYRGARVGSGARLALDLDGLDRLRGWDRVGRALAVLAALALVIWAGRRWCLAAALAAILVAAGLHGWSLGWGPVLAGAEVLPIALVLIGLVWRLMAWMRRTV